MRISSNKADRGYSNFVNAREKGKTVRVYLNGKEVKECTIADDIEGFVVRRVLNGDGQIQIDPSNSELIWEERVHGEVKIVIV